MTPKLEAGMFGILCPLASEISTKKVISGKSSTIGEESVMMIPDWALEGRAVVKKAPENIKRRTIILSFISASF